jgi:phosphoglycolate phosphatase
MHLLFDLDGTLTDSQSGIIRSIRHALTENGLDAPPAESLRWVIGPPILKTFEKLLGGESAHLFDPVVRSYRERYGRIGLFENEVYPEIENALVELTGLGHVLHVATSKATIYAARIIEHFELAKYFHSVDGSELDGTRADKAHLIAHILEREQIAPTDAIMIGDREHDMIGTTANKVPGIAVLWGYGTREELETAGAFACVHSPRELAETIRSNSPASIAGSRAQRASRP